MRQAGAKRFPRRRRIIVAVLLLLGALALWRLPLAMAAVVAFIFAADRLYTEDATVTVRSFFGVHKISETTRTNSAC